MSDQSINFTVGCVTALQVKKNSPGNDSGYIPVEAPLYQPLEIVNLRNVTALLNAFGDWLSVPGRNEKS